MKLVAIILVLVVAFLVFPRQVHSVQVIPGTEHMSDPQQDLLDYRPNQPSPVELSSKPYRLLDSMAIAKGKRDLTSQSCFNADFQQTIEKTGNFNQMTNNYKRNFPDSCSGLRQELTMNFYEPI